MKKQKFNSNSFKPILCVFINFLLIFSVNAQAQFKTGSGNAMSFGVTDKRVSLDNSNNNARPTSSITVEAWINISANVQYGGIICNVQDNGADEAGFFLHTNGSSTNNVQFSVVTINNDLGSAQALATVPLNTVSHIAATYDGSNVKLYVNGVLKSTVAKTGSIDWTSSNPTLYNIGSYVDDNENYAFNGKIDEVRIWRTALTTVQIQERMCRKITNVDALYPNLISYYNFDESTGNTVFDATSNAINGTLTNSPTRVTSAFPIGNASAYNYNGNNSSVNLAQPTRGDDLTASVTSGTADGIQVYCVTESPNTTSGVTGVGTNNSYFGVFVVNGNSPEYTATYNYDGLLSMIPNESDLALFKRTNNEATTWSNASASINTTANTLTCTGQNTEYMVGSLGAVLAQVTTTGLQLYLPFNGNANDASGNGNNATTNNATLTSDRFGNPNSAYSFNGSNQRIIIPDAPTLRPTNLTLSVWVNSQQSNGLGAIVGKPFLNTNCDAYQVFEEAGYNTFTTVTCNLVQDNTHSPFLRHPRTLNAWKHLVYVVDDDNNLVKFYVDGVLSSSAAWNNSIAYDMASLFIGAALEGGGETFYFNGKIDDIRLYNRTLTNTEITALFTENNTQCNVVGGSLNFDGNNDNVSLGNLHNQQVFSVEMWVKPAATQVDHADIIDNNSNETRSWACQQVRDIPNRYFFYVSNSVNQFALLEFNLEKDKWQHLTLVKETNAVKVYVDGNLVGNTAYTGTVNYDGTQFLRLGSWGGGGRNWKGGMDEVRLWNRALTQTEIQARKDCELNTAQVNEPLLSAYYKFNQGQADCDNTTLSTLTDEKGARNGTLQNFALTGSSSNFAVGKVSGTCSPDCSVTSTPAGALRFDGSDDKVELGNWFNHQVFSIEMWVKPGTTQVTYANIIDNNHATSINWVCQQDGSGSPNRYLFGANGAAVFFDLMPNVWQHLVLVKEEKMVRVYVNGTLISSVFHPNPVNYNGAQSLRLGAVGGGGRYWNGSMDEVRMWSRVLCQAEIQAHKDCELSGTQTNLLAYYKFNQGFANCDNSALTTLTDETGAHNGTLQNFALTGINSNFTAGQVTGACTSVGSSTLTTLYRDADGDGFGDPSVPIQTCATPTTGFVTNNTDCDDTNANSHRTSILTNAITGLNTVYCRWTASSAITLTASPSGGIFTVDGTVATTFNPSLLSVGNHPVVYTLTSANGCVGTQTLNVLVDTTRPNALITGSNFICPSSSTTLTASGGVSYLWSTGATTTFIDIAPTVSTLYTVTVTGTNGCTQSDTQQVNILPIVAPNRVSNRLPANNSINIPSSLEFSWFAAANANNYELLVWTNDNPTAPSVFAVGNTFRYNTNLLPNKEYSWTVVSKNTCATTFAENFSFTTRGLPDLTVDSVTISQPIKAGKTITISYRVRNKGTYTTGNKSWNDYVYLSPDEDLRIGDDILLDKIPNQTYLLAGETYMQTRTITLPERNIGIYHLFVIANVEDAYCISVPCSPTNRGHHSRSFEETTLLNNYLDTLITIEISPTPNFVADTILANPSVIFGGDTLNVSWKISNRGTSNYVKTLNSPYKKPWTDSIYISKNPVFDNTATILTTVSSSQDDLNLPIVAGTPAQNYLLSIDSSLRLTGRYIIPPRYNGRYYVHLKTDFYNEVYEGGLENDNIAVSDSIKIIIKTPSDLEITAMSVPDSIFSGQTLNTTWTVSNESATTTNASGWIDNVYLSKAATFKSDSATLIGSFYRGGALSSGQTYNAQSAKTLERDLSGDFYVYVFTDFNDNVHEWGGSVAADYNLNNIRRSTSKVKIKLSAFPDLVTTSVLVDKTAVNADSSFTATITFKNTGTANTTQGFDYSVNVKDSITGNITAYLGNFYVDTPLNSGDSVTKTLRLTAPNVTTAKYKLNIYADNQNRVYELDKENNNENLSSGFTITVRPPVPIVYCDLAVSNLAATGTAASGQPLSISATLRNIGTNPALSLTYQVILSNNTTLGDGDDYYLTTTYASSALGAGLSVNNTANVTLPNGILGNKYLFAKVQATGINPDNNAANDVQMIPLSITLSPYQDLTITAFTAEAQAYAGQNIKVYYTIRNNGTGDLNGKLYTGLWLSPSPSTNGQLLTTKLFDGVLAVGSSRIDSMTVALPSTSSGGYYLYMLTDNNNLWYEYTFEGNNDANRTINVLPITQSQADLVVKNVTVTNPSVKLGERDTFTFKVVNIGTTPTSGSNRQAVYLSSDANFSSDDRIVGSETNNNFFLNAGDSATVSLSNVMQDKEGTFYPIARTNLQATVPESNLDNDTKAATSTIAISTNVLPLSTWDATTLNDVQPRYYRIAVSEGKDLRIKLEQTNSTEAQGMSNRLYIAYNRVPSAQDYDVISETDGANPTALLPSTQVGNYYLLIRAEVPSSQNIRVRADALEFSLDSISPGIVGKGIVTTSLTGAGFRYNTNQDTLLQTRAYLKKAGATIAVGTLTTFTSTMQMDIRWDLTNVAVGVYDVVLLNPNGVSVTFASGLTVEEKKENLIEITFQIPEITRLGRPAYWQIRARNTGNVNIDFASVTTLFAYHLQTDNFQLDKNVYSVQKLIPRDSALNIVENEGIKDFTVLIAGLKPRQLAQFSFRAVSKVEGLVPSTIYSSGYTKNQFIANKVYQFEKIRKHILAYPSLHSNEENTKAQDKRAYLEFASKFLIDKGLLVWQDILNYLNNPKSCVDCADYYDIEPGFRTGTATVQGNLDLSSQSAYNWEINVPFGQAGDTIGWDLVRVNGRVNITSTTTLPFKINIRSINPCTGQADILTTWEAWHDYRWPILIASGGIQGFDTTKFDLFISDFISYNRIWGGKFKIEQSGDTLLIKFVHRERLPNEAGVDGGYGLCGYNGGNGGKGGINAKSGKGGHGANGTYSTLAGNGGKGGLGDKDTEGGDGGDGGNGYVSQNGGNGGDGGDGKLPGKGGKGGKASLNYEPNVTINRGDYIIRIITDKDIVSPAISGINGNIGTLINQ